VVEDLILYTLSVMTRFPGKWYSEFTAANDSSEWK